MNLAEVKCIVSGGAQGLGRHVALRLCQAGAQVAIGDVNPQGLADTLELIEMLHPAAGRNAPGDGATVIGVDFDRFEPPSAA